MVFSKIQFNEVGGKIMKEFVGLEQKHVYVMDDDSEKKKAKGTKKCVIKRELIFENRLLVQWRGYIKITAKI